MRLAIDHRLSVTPPPGMSQVVLHLLLTPPSGPTQSVESWSVEGPGVGNAGRFVDGFGNAAHLLNQVRPEGEIVIQVRGEVVTRDTHGVLGRPAGEPVAALYRRRTPLTRVKPSLYSAHVGSAKSRLDVLHALMARVGETLGLPPEREKPTQMQANGGQQQSQGATEATAGLPPAADYAHLFIGAVRALGIPARFVTGYRAGAEGDPGGLHAWAEAFDEGLGWIGFDPVHQLCPTERYVRLAIGLDAETAPTLRMVPVSEIVQVARVDAL